MLTGCCFEELNARGCFGLYHDELELDFVVLPGIWEQSRSYVLRFQKPPYDMFLQLETGGAGVHA